MKRPHTIALYSPAGRLIDFDTLDRAVERLHALGHRVVEDRSARVRFQRFAGDDDERLAALARVNADPEVDLAMAVRGGYGWSRLLDRIDFAALARGGKRWIGHSDFTAFQLAALAAAGMTTFAGPMAAYDFGAESPSAFTVTHCFGLLDADSYDVECAIDGPPIDVEGRLWGGNLTLVTHLVGTPYLPRIDGGILFLEDTAEHPYRVERMLLQLLHAGILPRQRAILLGAFSDYTLYPHDDGYDLPAAIEVLRSRLPVPICRGLPFGHVRDKLTLPVGGVARVVVRGGWGTLAFREYG